MIIRIATLMAASKTQAYNLAHTGSYLLTPFGTARRSESYIDKDKVNNIFASALILFV
jgi:hypothetical protein